MQNIELSFCSNCGNQSRWIYPITDPSSSVGGKNIRTPPTEVNFDKSDPESSSTALECPEYFSTPVAPSYLHIRLGERSMVDVVKHLEQLLGCKLDCNIRQAGDKTKIVLEVALAQNSATGENSDMAQQTASEILDGGVFDVGLVRNPNTEHRKHDLMFIKLSQKFCTPPTIILGMNSLEVDRGMVVRIKTYVDNIHEHIFCAHISSWLASKLNRASVNWLALPSGHTSFQAGSFNIAEDPTWKPGVINHAAHRKIDFPHSYEIPPTVIVWLNYWDSSHVHTMAFATDVTATGFTIHVNCLDTHHYGAQVSWFAYPTGYPGICSGNVLLGKDTFGAVKFDRKFKTPPKTVLVGLNKLEADKSKSCSFNIIKEAVSEIGMGIKVEGWGDTILNSAGVAYIAIQ